jgi:hypothetical protein
MENFIRFKGFFRRYLCIDKVAKHWTFELFMFIMVIGSSTVAVWLSSDPNEEISDVLNQVDDILAWVFVGEAFVRIIGMGLSEYWSDNWNKFDMLLLISNFSTDYAFSFLGLAKSAKSVRFLKITRLQKTMKVTRSLRSFRLFRMCEGIMSVCIRITKLIEIIIVSLPTIWRIFTMMIILFYIYSLIGLELFRSTLIVNTAKPPFGMSNFNSLGEGMLELNHILVTVAAFLRQNSWSDLMYSYAVRFDAPFAAQLYFISFHSIVIFVLRTVLSGLVWEVFSIKNKESAKKESEMAKVSERSKQQNSKLFVNYFKIIRSGQMPTINSVSSKENANPLDLDLQGSVADLSSPLNPGKIPNFETKSPGLLKSAKLGQRNSLQNHLNSPGKRPVTQSNQFPLDNQMSIEGQIDLKKNSLRNKKSRQSFGLKQEKSGIQPEEMVLQPPTLTNQLKNLNLNSGLEEDNFAIGFENNSIKKYEIEKWSNFEHRDLFRGENDQIIAFSDSGESELLAKKNQPTKNPLGPSKGGKRLKRILNIEDGQGTFELI